MSIPVFGELGNIIYKESIDKGENRISSFFAASAMDLIASYNRRKKHHWRNLPIMAYDCMFAGIVAGLSVVTSTRLSGKQKEKCVSYLLGNCSPEEFSCAIPPE